jgi:hypothetical protein
MNNYDDLEEANKEVEKSKVILHDTESPDDKKSKEGEGVDEDKNVAKEEGSGIFTADGKELPEIEGGYDIVDPGGSLGDDEFVSI